MSFIAPPSLQAFAAIYPLTPTTLRHGLADHPLLSLDALATASAQLPAAHVERRIANAVNGGAFAMDQAGASDSASVIRAIGDSGNWMMLRFVEQLPAYRELLHDLMGEIDGVIAPRTGSSHSVKGFIFISAPGTLTPFHFDCEYNILFQIAGDKQFATYPPAPPYLTLERREAYYDSGDNMLPWADSYEALATVHPLSPGDALFVPYAAPHWVKAGASPSISLSMTWQSDWSMAAADALGLNPLLRKVGLRAGDLPEWPKAPRLRALGGRVARKAGLL